MARNAREFRVVSGEREFRLAVIERCRRPSRRRVTDRTIRREPCALMIRVARPVVVLQMTGSTVGRCSGVLPADVTAQACDCGMLAAQRIIRVLRMIETCVCPVRSGVADAAIRGPSESHVVRIFGRLEE